MKKEMNAKLQKEFTKTLVDRMEPKERLYRHMDFPKFVSILQYRKLFFPLSSSLPDRAEGLRFTKRQLIERKGFSNLVCRWFPELVEEEKSKIALDDIENLKQEMIKDFILINSWYASKHESFLMWQTYLSCSEGICIRTTRKALGESFKTETRPFLRPTIHDVNYAGASSIEPEYLAHFIKKRKEFEAEKEVRAIIDLHPEFGTNENRMENKLFKEIVLGRGLGIDVDVNSLLDGVIVGPESGNWFYGLVQDVLETYGFNRSLVEHSTIRDS